MEKIPMTPTGHAALEAELKNLKSVERPAIIKAIAEAREHGDLSENAEYPSAREKQSFIEGRIKEIEGILSLAEVIDPARLSGPIKLGANVVWNSSGDPFVQIKTISDVANSPFIIANPSFVNAREGNVRLTATSPALNSADGSGTTVRDIDGRSVPATRRDIGAFER